MRILLFFLFISNLAFGQLNPAITHWIINHTGATGFGGIKTNVQQVQYSTSNVYVSCTDIADWIPLGYDWPNNPNFAGNQNFVFKITLNPVKNNGTLVATPLGHTGVWINGVSIFNMKDARSYNNANIWYQNAFFFEHQETETMDSCLGHPNMQSEYHLHVAPQCLWDEADSTHHSPLLGYAFDGFPVYGSYGYANADGTGGIKRLEPNFRLRNITDRTTLPDGTVLTSTQYGPSLSTYPLGAYLEDYEYVNGLGDLDEHNGRFTVTPEYPSGIYAYFVTIDSLLQPKYPYVMGYTYYGTVPSGNTGPGSGHNTVGEPVTVYTSVDALKDEIAFLVYPNPVKDDLNFFIIPSHTSNLTARLTDMQGRVVKEVNNVQTAVNYTLDVRDLAAGNYFMGISYGEQLISKRVIILH